MENESEERVDNEPVVTIYRTNGVLWARFLRYEDDTEEPDDIFPSPVAMLADAAKQHRPIIEWQPQLLGCETSEEASAVETLIAAHQELMKLCDQRD